MSPERPFRILLVYTDATARPDCVPRVQAHPVATPGPVAQTLVCGDHKTREVMARSTTKARRSTQVERHGSTLLWHGRGSCRKSRLLCSAVIAACARVVGTSRSAPLDPLTARSSHCPVLLHSDWRRESLAFPREGDYRWSFGRILFDRLLICTVPGAVSTWAREFITKLAHASNRTDLEYAPGKRASNRTNLEYAPGKRDPHPEIRKASWLDPHPEMRKASWLTPLEVLPDAEVAQIACNASWTRLAIVRNPYARLWSKFRDKIITRRENRLPHDWHDGTNFSRFLRRLANTDNISSHTLHEAWYVDEHFRRQSNFCGMRSIPYEIIHSEHLKQHMESLVVQLGVDKDPEVQAMLTQLKSFNASAEREQLLHTYSAEDLSIVERYFAEDFIRLGYPTGLVPKSRSEP